MIKAIDELTCTNCGLCEEICPTDVFSRENGKVYIAYHDDCSFCRACIQICPMEAISYSFGVPAKFNRLKRWELIKAELKIVG